MTIAEQNLKYMDDMALTTQLINQRPGRMIQLASLLNRYASRPKYFGDGDYVSLIEIGILVYISSFPGVTMLFCVNSSAGQRVPFPNSSENWRIKITYSGNPILRMRNLICSTLL